MVFSSSMYLKCALFLIFPTSPISAFMKSSSHWPCLREMTQAASHPPGHPSCPNLPCSLDGGGTDTAGEAPALMDPLSVQMPSPRELLTLAEPGQNSSWWFYKDFWKGFCCYSFITSFYSFHYLLLKLLLGLPSACYFLHLHCQNLSGFSFYLCLYNILKTLSGF